MKMSLKQIDWEMRVGKTCIRTERDEVNRQTITTVIVTDEDRQSVKFSALDILVLEDPITEPADILQNLQIFFLRLHQQSRVMPGPPGAPPAEGRTP